MASRHPQNPKHIVERYETDYERWLKDHDEPHQLEGKPRYHPSDADSTTNHDEILLGEATSTKTKSKTEIQVSHSHAEDVVDDDGTVVRVSRYGSIMYPAKHDAAPKDSVNKLGTNAGTNICDTVLRIGQRESIMCCGSSVLFLVVCLVGLGWGVRRYRQRQRQQRQRDIDGISFERTTSEKMELMEKV